MPRWEMIIKCVVACQGFDGPTFTFVQVKCTKEEYNNGDHYDAAKEWAKSEGYEDPMVVFDHRDGPEWLLKHFEWKSASITTNG